MDGRTGEWMNRWSFRWDSKKSARVFGSPRRSCMWLKSQNWDPSQQRGGLGLELGIRVPGCQSQLGPHLAVCLGTIYLTLWAAVVLSVKWKQSQDFFKVLLFSITFTPKPRKSGPPTKQWWDHQVHSQLIHFLDCLFLVWLGIAHVFSCSGIYSGCHFQHTFLSLAFKGFTVCPQPTNPPHFSAFSIWNLPLLPPWPWLASRSYMSFLFHLWLLNLGDFIKLLLASTKFKSVLNRSSKNKILLQERKKMTHICIPKDKFCGHLGLCPSSLFSF